MTICGKRFRILQSFYKLFSFIWIFSRYCFVSRAPQLNPHSPALFTPMSNTTHSAPSFKRLDSASVSKFGLTVKRLEEAKLAHDLALIRIRFDALEKAFGEKTLIINGVRAVRNENGKIGGFLGCNEKDSLERCFEAVFGFKI